MDWVLQGDRAYECQVVSPYPSDIASFMESAASRGYMMSCRAAMIEGLVASDGYVSPAFRLAKNVGR